MTDNREENRRKTSSKKRRKGEKKQDGTTTGEGEKVVGSPHVDNRGCELQGFLEGTLSASPRFVASPEGALTPNPDASVFNQQDKLLASWLISTISSSLLSCFTSAKSACEIWSTANRLFATSTGAKISRMKHDLHSTKKGDLIVKEYVAKIQNICALLAASGSAVSEAEKVEVVSVGLSSDFDAVLTLASFSTEPLPFQ
ncbi:hypothetical protein PVK06_022975 [Gossypium arboreum]|uniref:Uncharacterized protein n=1 Tax=Gossypium arboreum TaxID=29729 RepID=A0ABR0P9T1_GOSAR|nr:hypothetical protein PVK06_022975 [Gossypium arboreum]